MPGPFGLLPSASNLYGFPGQGYFPGNPVAGINPWQHMGYQNLIGAGNMMASYAPQMMGAAQNALGGYQNFLSGGGAQIDPQFLNMMSPEEINAIQGNFEVSPYVQGSVDAFNQAAQRGFERNVLPTLNLDAVMAGGAGGNRHALAQGLATSDFSQQLQENAARLTNQAWQQAARNQLTSRGQTLGALGQERARGTNAALANARNQISAWGQMPGMLGAYGNMASQASGLSMLPGQAMLGYGGALQGNAQQQLNAEMARWNWERENPWNRLSQYAAIVGGMPAPQASAYNPVNPFGMALSGAGLGFQLGGMFNSSPMGGSASLGSTPMGLPGYQGGFQFF